MWYIINMNKEIEMKKYFVNNYTIEKVFLHSQGFKLTTLVWKISKNNEMVEIFKTKKECIDFCNKNT